MSYSKMIMYAYNIQGGVPMWKEQTIKLNESRTHFKTVIIEMSSYQYRKSHCGDQTVVRSSYPHNGISYTGKMTSLYWIIRIKPEQK